MRRSVLLAVAIALAWPAACRRDGPLPPMMSPILEGTLEVAGLAAPVQIVRDRFGVPHVVAESRDDLFFAQGFVQAQDRLFQMDLWRRAAQGRLSEVLGANFIERDSMTRRLQFHGDPSTDWAVYGDAARAIAQAFVAGINGWVAIAQRQPSELFRLAGWRPEMWDVADLLNRTDAFDRAGTIEAAAQSGLPEAVVDAVRRAAVPPFFTGLQSAVWGPVTRTAKREPAADRVLPIQGDALPSPSPRYLIHLHAPQWNAIGAAVPWRPGLVVGHDGSASWDRMEPQFRATVRAEPLDPKSGRVVRDTVVVKGRTEPFAYDTQITARGVVIATDRAGGKQFTLDWEGFRAGTSPAFGGNGPRGAAGGQPPSPHSAPGHAPQIVFQHLLAITRPAQERFNIGPLNRPADDRPLFSITWDERVRDGSRAMNAPGQSEWRESTHYSDLAALWAMGQTVPLVYTDAAVAANRQSTLTLTPRRD